MPGWQSRLTQLIIRLRIKRRITGGEQADSPHPSECALVDRVYTTRDSECGDPAGLPGQDVEHRTGSA